MLGKPGARSVLGPLDGADKCERDDRKRGAGERGEEEEAPISLKPEPTENAGNDARRAGAGRALGWTRGCQRVGLALYLG